MGRLREEMVWSSSVSIGSDVRSSGMYEYSQNLSFLVYDIQASSSLVCK